VIAFAQLAGGAFFGVVVGLLVQWWKSSRDELRLLCDEFAKAVRDTSDLGSAYWLSTPAEPGGSRLSEARIIGLQRQLDGYRVLIRHRFRATERSALETSTADFFDAMTGSDFMSPTRPRNADQATLAQVRGADLILTIRQGFVTSVSLLASVRYYVRRLVHGPIG
jgi:hypothetical protein